MPTFSRREIEQTITERIRLQAVALGYLPDVTAFATKSAYLAARQAIITAGKQVIDVFGVGINSSRGEKFYPRIYLNTRQYNPGSFGHWSDSGYVQTGNNPVTFAREQVYGSPKNTLYDIRIESGDKEATFYARLCLEMVMAGITTSDVGIYMPVLRPDLTFDEDRRFLIKYTGAQEIKNPKWLGHLITFETVDVWLDSDIPGNSWDTTFPTVNIPPLTRVIGEGGPEGEPPETIIDVEP